MPIASVTLSSVGTSPVLGLNWRGARPATLNAVSSSSGSSADFTVQYSLQDPVLAGGTSAVTWFGFSSNTFAIDSAGGVHYSAASIFPDGVYIPLPTPVAAVRLNSSSIAASNTLTLYLLQGDGG
jgi:hypothetical protein